jgi:hypothetical protein
VVPDDPASNLMQFGAPIDEFEASPIIQGWYDREFGEAISCAAEVLGIDFDRFEWDLVAAPAHQDLQITNGVIKKGTVSAINSIPYVCAAEPGLMKPVVQGHFSPELKDPGFSPPALKI